MEFTDFFRLATDREDSEPYAYQAAVARDGLPDVLEVPTGAGKTFAAVGGWMYRRLFHPDPAVRAATPRRLVYALPMRVLVESVTSEVMAMRDRLGLHDELPVLQLMGGSLGAEDVSGWRVAMDSASVVVGTVDQIVSRQLLRGYGASRRTYPIDFALVTNGAHVVVDEIQLAGQATSTTRQIAAFQRRYGTAEPTGLTCMSATVDSTYLATVDNPYPAEDSALVRLTAEDRRGPLARRLAGTRRITRLDDVTTDAVVARNAVERHHEGTLTLVVVNRVDEAVAVHKALSTQLTRGADRPDLLLVHSRFRGRERAELNERLRDLTGDKGRERLDGTAGTIVVATQAVEAGVDLDATTLITEVARWSSLCQRAGRCNRAGLAGGGDETSAYLYWFDRGRPQPYEAVDVGAAVDRLTQLEGRAVTSEDLLGTDVTEVPEPLSILRAPDFVHLFDTSPDLSGGDLDVSRYIRADRDSDIQVAWIDPATLALDAVLVRPDPPWRVSVPIAALQKLLSRPGVRAWIYNPFTERWVAATSRTALRPQDLILVDQDSGGYDTERGFDPTLKTRVTPIHSDAPAAGKPDDDKPTSQKRESDQPTDTGADESSSDPASFTAGWQRLDDHLAEARAQAEHIQRGLGLPTPELDTDVVTAVAAAVHTHDLGKSFPGWQNALRRIGTDANGQHEQGHEPPEGLLAKAPRDEQDSKKRDPRKHTTDEALNEEDQQPSRRVRRLIVRADPVRESGTLLDPAAKRRKLERWRRVFRHELASVLYLRSREGRALLNRLGVPEHRHPLVDYLVGAHHGVLRVTPRDPVSDGRDGAMLLGIVDGEWLPDLDLGELSLPGLEADLSLFAGGGDSWGLLAADLLDEFGPFRLAYLETVTRISDWRASGARPTSERTA